MENDLLLLLLLLFLRPIPFQRNEKERNINLIDLNRRGVRARKAQKKEIPFDTSLYNNSSGSLFPSSVEAISCRSRAG